jgi:hypothetical protein
MVEQDSDWLWGQRGSFVDNCLAQQEELPEACRGVVKENLSVVPMRYMLDIEGFFQEVGWACGPSASARRFPGPFFCQWRHI